VVIVSERERSLDEPLTGAARACAQMDCPSRAVFKQLMDHGTVGDTKEFRKSIIVLEANVGWLEMQELIHLAGSRDKVRAGSVWE
jgi:hypothetical protein